MLFLLFKKYNTYENKEYPYLGSDEDRKQYVLYFNKIFKNNVMKISVFF